MSHLLKKIIPKPLRPQFIQSASKKQEEADVDDLRNQSNPESVQNEELKMEEKLRNWTIPKIGPKKVYRFSTFNFTQNLNIKTIEQNVPVSKDYETIKPIPGKVYSSTS